MVHFRKTIQLSLVQLTGDLVVHFPDVVSGQLEDNTLGQLREQLVLLGQVVHDLNFWLTKRDTQLNQNPHPHPQNLSFTLD